MNFSSSHAHLNLADRWTLGAATVTLLASSFLIFDTGWVFHFVHSDRKNLVKVAEVNQLNSDVRRRTESEIAFLPIALSQEIYQGDSIYTGPGSQAQVQFKDGSKIDIEPKSLVSIQVNQKVPKIEIDRGTVSGKLQDQQKMTLSIKGHESELSGKDALIQVSVSKEGSSQITVLSGTASVKSETTTISLKKNERTEVQSNGKIGKKSSFNIELLKPSPGQKIWKQSSDPIELSWNIPKEQIESKITLETAQDREFTKISSSKKLIKQRTFIYNVSESGIFYWRIRTEGSTSPTYSFEILNIQAPELISPSNNSKFQYLKQGPIKIKGAQSQGAQITLKWKDLLSRDVIHSKNEVQVFTQVSHDPPLETLAFHTQGTMSEIITSPLMEGLYTWRVRSLYPGTDQEVWSAPHTFSVTTPAPPEPLKSEFHELAVPSGSISPRANQQIEIDPMNSPSSILFNWNEVPGADGYDIQISNDSQFSTMEREIQVKTHVLKANHLSFGRHYWRIRATQSTATHSQWTHAFRFQLIERKTEKKSQLNSPLQVKIQSFKAPTLISPVGRVSQKINHEYNFEWEKIEGAQSYEVTLNQETNASRTLASGEKTSSVIAQRFKVDHHSMHLVLPLQGRYTWTVRALASRSSNDLASTQTQSPTSRVNFEIDEPRVARKSPARLSFTTQVSPLSNSLNLSLPQLSSSVQTPFAYGSFLIGNEFWLSPHFGLGLVLEGGLFSVGSAQAQELNFGLTAQYAVLKEETSGWHLAPFLGIEGRQFPDFFATEASAFTTLGMSIGITIRKSLSERWELASTLKYYDPLFITGSTGGSAALTSGISSTNFSFTLEGSYWIHPRLGISLGGLIDLRSVSYINAQSANLIDLQLNGTYLTGGLIYRFGD